MRAVKSRRKYKMIMYLATLIFAVYSLALLYPLLFALNSALKNGDADFIMNLTKITTSPRFMNLLDAFLELEVSGVTFLNMFINSVWFALGTTVFSVFSSMCLAYGVAKYKFIGQNFVYNLVLVIMIFPTFGTTAARYRLYDNLGFIDSPLMLFAYAGAFDAAFLVLYAFFKNISWTYAESAFMDGASHFTVFFKIMLPMTKPAIAALLVTNFIGNWNNYADVLMYLPNLPTLSTGLHVYSTKMMYAANRPLYYAGMLISLIPVFIVFFLLQETVMKVTFEGGIKE